MAESTVIPRCYLWVFAGMRSCLCRFGRRNAPLRLSDALAGLSDYGRQDAVVDLAAEADGWRRWGTRAASQRGCATSDLVALSCVQGEPW